MIQGNFQNQVLQFNIDLLAPHGSKIITVKSDLLVADSNQKQPVGNFDQFTQPEEFVESDHRFIVMEANGLKNENLSVMVDNIATWVNDHIKDVSYSSKPHGALYAFNHRKGDCTEFMTLTMALLRANNIPAMGVAGYICPGNMVLKPDDYHNWVEYHDGKTWRVIDPLNKKKNIPDTDYIAMRVIDRSEKESFQQLERVYYDRDIGVDISMK